MSKRTPVPVSQGLGLEVMSLDYKKDFFEFFCDDKTVQMFNELWDMAMDRDDRALQFRVIESILNRLAGKPTEVKDVKIESESLDKLVIGSLKEAVVAEVED